MEEEKIKGVEMVVAGKLEMRAGWKDLEGGLAGSFGGANSAPTVGARPIGEQGAKGVQNNRFTKHVGVRGEVDR
jgi:hypothetical protein